jgi:hypothetical protein
MLTQVLDIIGYPGVQCTSSDGTWENLIFDDPIYTKPPKDVYERALYNLTYTEEMRILAFNKLREERNALLDKSDKYMTRDYPHKNSLEDWIVYRQALRDLPRTARPTLDADGNLKDVEWPPIPSA